VETEKQRRNVAPAAGSATARARCMPSAVHVRQRLRGAGWKTAKAQLGCASHTSVHELAVKCASSPELHGQWSSPTWQAVQLRFPPGL